MAAKTKIWSLEPHSAGKHKVLKHYLDAWFPKLGRWSGRILLVDGFCGPGEYDDGQPGSPIIALDAFANHSGRDGIGADVVFLFGDADQTRLDHLDSLVKHRHPLPKKTSVHLSCGDFNEQMTKALDDLDSRNQRLAPAFVMLDPFGVSDTPMSLVERILGHEKSEVYVSFMYEAINRFKKSSEFGPHLDSLFGTAEWRSGCDIADRDERKKFFYNLYETQLKNAGASDVVRFELFNENRLVYAIFFATHHWQGANAMKQAIWKVDPFGSFQFRGTRSGALFGSTAVFDPTPLKEALRNEFAGSWIKIEAVLQFVGSDRTDFHTGQVKTKVLKPLELAGLIDVDPTSRRRVGTYPSGTTLRFL